MTIQIDDTISLETLEQRHASSLLQLVNNNRSYLREWLTWVDHMQTVTDFENYISHVQKQAIAQTDFSFAILVNKNIAGRIGIHHINHQHKIGEIGYWLTAGLQGRGIITQCCKAIIQHAFYELSLNRIEIKCATGNEKSIAVAEKLKFKQEGILRQAELLHGKFIDLYLYALLHAEWEIMNAC